VKDPGLFSLQGKVAVITGAGGLLGNVHCDALASCGAQVVVSDVSVEKAKSTSTRLGKKWGKDFVHALRIDVTDEESVESGKDKIIELFGKVDILINNAAVDPKVTEHGIQTGGSRFENFQLEEWNKELSVGLSGAFICSKVFGTWMAEHGGGVILNIASDLSVIAPDQRIYRKEGVPENLQPVKPVTYPVIKTGLIGLTRYLATYWADKSIRVNALSPGGIYTDQPVDFVEKLSERIPLKRMASGSDYIGAVQFLCSDASRYMTGQNMVVDGGRSVW